METLKKDSKSNYKKLGLMMLTSFVLMYGIMFLNAYQLDHVMWSTMRTYMTLLMVAPMAISMMLFMWGMYHDKKLNYIIIGFSLLVFCVSFYGVRTQSTIGDVQWMKAMIPHHSSAILTSSRATISDPEVKKLAADIVEAQKQEIAEMKQMINRLQNKQSK